jgi:ribosomal protein RSM22 (predicted rRNA methylase)
METVVRQARQTFGSTLPAGFLSSEEYKLYERLYGPPLRDTRPEDVGLSFEGESGDFTEGGSSKNTLLRETRSGVLEEVEYSLDKPTATTSEADALESLAPTLSEAQIGFLNATANNQREYDALVQLQRDFKMASLRVAEEESKAMPEEEPETEEIDEEQDYEDEEEPGAVFARRESRLHEYTVDGQFKTSPRTLYLPKQEFVEPISELLGRVSNRHLRETAERIFGGPGLPHSASTPEVGKTLPLKGVAVEAGHHRMSEVEADAFIASVLPGVYASATSALVEVRKRLGSKWMKDLLARGGGEGPRVLDAGGAGAGLVAWEQIARAEWEVLREKDEVSGRRPAGKKTVVVGSDNLRHRISRFLDETTFLPRLPDYMHSIEMADRLLDAREVPQQRKTFDIIIASHLLLPQLTSHRRKAILDNLWALLSPEGGVLVVLEKGHARGFEAVADVRQRLLDEFIIPPGSPQSDMQAGESEENVKRRREPGMILAPCTNHAKCPMYLRPGLSTGRKDFCHFNQRYIRPHFLQQIVGASHSNHEDIAFSFVAVQRGGEHSTSTADATTLPFMQGVAAADLAFGGYGRDGAETKPHPLSLPRNLLPPIKRRGHVTLDVCTPAGALERWTVPRSFGKQAYHDARKARWGDLWALGAKTRVRRQAKAGRGGEAIDGRKNKAGDASKKRPRGVDLTVGATSGHIRAKERQPHRDRGRQNDFDDILQDIRDELNQVDDAKA